MGGSRHALEGDSKGRDRHEQTSYGGAQRRAGVAARGIGGERLDQRCVGASRQDASDGGPSVASVASSRQRGRCPSASRPTYPNARAEEAQQVTFGRRFASDRGRRGAPARPGPRDAVLDRAKRQARPTCAEPSRRRGARQVWTGAPAPFVVGGVFVVTWPQGVHQDAPSFGRRGDGKCDANRDGLR